MLCYIFQTFITQMVFEAIDVNKDGRISLAEYIYAGTSFCFHSGPDDPNSLFFGDLVEPEEEE